VNKIEAGIIASGYQYLEVADLVYLVYDFLEASEIEAILKQINSSSQEDWESHYMNGIIGLAERKFGRTDLDNLISEGLIEITHHWVDKNLPLSDQETRQAISERVSKIVSMDESVAFDGVGTIQRQYEGAELREHVDDHADPLIKYAVIMYINDDYLEGELFFRNLDFKIKPPAGSLLIFPSGEKYLHGVMPPGDGPHRYVLPSFVREKGGKYETASTKE
jgi:hypothetical protein